MIADVREKQAVQIILVCPQNDVGNNGNICG
jgi:hypothetical protein